MKLLVIGSSGRYAIEKPYVKYLSLQPLVESVQLFPAKDLFLAYYEKTLLNKVLYRAGFSFILKIINEEIRRAILAHQPEVVFVFKGMEIFPETLQWIKRQEVKLVNYNPDSPFHFSGRGSGNLNVTRSIDLYDLHFTYHLGIKAKLEEEFQLPTVLLPFGFDLSALLFDECHKLDEIQKACFVGNPDRDRSAFLRRLAESGIQIDIYGHGWNKFVKHRNLTIHEAVYGDDFWKVLRRYRVQLNLMRPHNPDSHNMRSFEVPSVGGIMLAPRTTDHGMFFNDGKETFLYDNLTDCAEKARMLLGMSSQEASVVREAARKRCIRSRYHYNDRAHEVVAALRALLDNK